MIKRILLYGVLSTFIQTLIYFLFVKLLQYIEILSIVKNKKQITEAVVPYAILIFFEITLIQNILSSIINKKKISWILFLLSLLFLIAPFLKQFTIWPSIPFSLILIVVLLSPLVIKNNCNKIIQH